MVRRNKGLTTNFQRAKCPIKIPQQNDDLRPNFSTIIHLPRLGRNHRYEAIPQPQCRYAASTFSISLQKIQKFHHRRICPCSNGRIHRVHSHSPSCHILRQLLILEYLVWRFPWTYCPLCCSHHTGSCNPQIHTGTNHEHYLSAHQRVDTPPQLWLD